MTQLFDIADQAEPAAKTRPTRERKPGELVGTFEGYRPKCKWPNDDGINETFIGTLTEEVSDGYLKHTIKGTSRIDAFKVGFEYRLFGRHTTHDRWGEQFFFESFIEEEPASQQAVCLYLEQVDGIGPATAQLIWQRFREESVAVLREEPDKIAAAVSRLTIEQCRAGSELLKKKQRTERGKMDLMALVHKAGVPKRIVDKALDTWGVNAAEYVRRNPYLLMRFSGIGFLKTDRMWLDFGHNPACLKRQALACWYSIARDCDGHVWFSIYVARDFLNQHISSAEVNFEKAMELATRAGILQKREVNGQVFIAEKVRAEQEGRVTRLIESSRIESRDHGTKWPSVDQIEELAGEDGEHQREQLRAALQGVVGILSGSPGTGKTFTAAALIKTIMRIYPTAMIAACAPTGKAAVRLTESLEKCGVNLAAKTIHSLLGVKSSGDDGFGFQHDRTNPLVHKFVLIDECFPSGTMVDTPSGSVPIEDISPGDAILNASGTDVVFAKLKKEVNRVAIITCGETQIVCSENHPVFTRRGVVLAGELRPGDSIVRTIEAMRLLRECDRLENNINMANSILLAALQHDVVDAVSRIQGKTFYEGSCGQGGRGSETIPCVGNSRGYSAGRSNSESQSDDYASRHAGKGLAVASENWPQAVNSRRQWQGYDSAAGGAFGDIGGELEARVSDWSRREISGIPNQLQSGLGEQHNKIGDRVRWQQAQKPEGTIDRREEGKNAGFAWVDSIEILESTDSRMDQYRDANGKLNFYDLQATRHRSYSVEGLLVHNCSMKDIPLFAAMLDARPMDGHYLILGDPNQLAPVGYGAPLRDLLYCPESAPAGTLSQIRRNSGRGIEVCAAIRDKKPWQPSRKLDADNGENLLIVDSNSPADQVEKLSNIVRKFRDASPQKYNPIWDVQVICAVNKKGELCRRKLNPLLQDLLNADGKGMEGCPFRVGDKIVNLRNGLLKSADQLNDDCDQDGRVYVANGEQGEVIEVEPGIVIAKMTSPPRTVLIPRKGKSKDQEAAEYAVKGEEPEGDGEGGDSEAATNTGCSWELGYAISAHKSQGSEWPVVIVMLDTDNSAKRTCSRQWLYTAISRFKKFALLIGTKRTADSMCQRDALMKRKTFLKERVEELKAATDLAEKPLPAVEELPAADELPDAEPLDCEIDEFDFDAILEGVL